MKRAKYIWASGTEVAADARHLDKNKYSHVSAFEIEGTLHIVGVIYLNSGVRFILQSDKGYTYYMSLPKFIELIQKQDVAITGKFGFFQQGAVYSLGLVD